jgi:integrase
MGRNGTDPAGKTRSADETSVTSIMGKLTAKGLKALLTKPPKRHADGGGLFFKTLSEGRAYWTYRFTLKGRETEMSLGAYPELGLDEARVIHLRRCADVAEGKDPVGERRKGRDGKATVLTSSGAPTFGHCADQHIALNEGGWKNSKHHAQWVATLKTYAAPIRETPVDKVTTADVLAVLKPIWNDKPETASRLRGRIEAVLASAQVDGWIPEDRPNPARWKNWLERKLPKPNKLGSRGHHKALPYDQLPALMGRLAAIDSVASRALQITILTCARTSEALGAGWDEVGFETATWTLPPSRMKMGREHQVPLSDAAVAILRRQYDERGANPHVFPGRPMRGLSNMALAMLMRRLKIDATVHGFRASARSWMADQGVQFELAEACLAHTVGSAAVQAYQRSSMLELRRPVLQKWADFICGDNVIDIKREVA